jgi:hypothetical protein
MRVGVKHESRFRPGIKRSKDDNLPIYEWFPKVNFAALKQKGIHPSDGFKILKAEIRKGTVLDPRKIFAVCFCPWAHQTQITTYWSPISIATFLP